jgi:hypothetical protein
LVHPLRPIGIAGAALFGHLEGFDNYRLLAKFQVHLVLQKPRFMGRRHNPSFNATINRQRIFIVHAAAR